jgi:hypothetical protein
VVIDLDQTAAAPQRIRTRECLAAKTTGFTIAHGRPAKPFALKLRPPLTQGQLNHRRINAALH